MYNVSKELEGLDYSTISRERNLDWEVTFPAIINSEDPFHRVLNTYLELDESNHDVMTVLLKGSLGNVERIVAGDPVKLSITYRGIFVEWIGYVYSIEIPVESTAAITRVICVGNSYFLKNAGQKIFYNVTSTNVAKKLAAKNGLKAVTSPHTHVYEMLSQAGQSDWQMLRRLSKQSGFALRVEGGDLIFKSRTDLYNESKLIAPYFKYVSQPVNNLSAFATIFNFEPRLSEQAPDNEGAGIKRIINGFDKVSSASVKKQNSPVHKDYVLNNESTSKFVKQTGAPVFERVITDEVTVSASHAKRILEARVNTETFRYRAKATLDGYPTLKPYQAIYLDGLPFGMSGFWTVMSVRHVLGGKTNYRMEVEVGTDQLGETYTGTQVSPDIRNVSAEIEGLISEPTTYTLENSTNLGLSYAVTKEIKDLLPVEPVLPNYTDDPYKLLPPDMSDIPQTFRWRAL